VSNQSLRQRTRNSSWQWLVIGVILGLGCSSVACLSGYVLGVVRIGTSASLIAELPTPTPPATYTPYPTYTPPPTATTGATATQTPASILTQAPTSSESLGMLVQPPTSTAFKPASTTIVGGPTAAPLGTASAAVIATLPPFTPAGSGASSGSDIALTLPTAVSDAQQQLLATASELLPINGGKFYLGTTQNEALQAVTDCTSRDKGQCKPEDAQDSTFKHYVVLDSFLLEKTEVSVDQYITFLNTLPTGATYRTGCGGQSCFAPQDSSAAKFSPVKLDGTLFKPTNDIYRSRPMTYVTWYGAKAYCEALGRRLPTEAEWERAARRKLDGDEMTIYPWGNQWDPTLANSSRSGPGGTGTLNALDVTGYSGGVSGEGVLNLAGNVSEWVNDWYGANYYRENGLNQTKPKGPTAGTTKVVRGGDWATTPFFLRAMQRRDLSPVTVNAVTGFRCAQDDTNGAAAVNSGNTSGGGTGGAIPTKALGTLAP